MGISSPCLQAPQYIIREGNWKEYIMIYSDSIQLEFNSQLTISICCKEKNKMGFFPLTNFLISQMGRSSINTLK